jgi:hypothetical protein
MIAMVSQMPALGLTSNSTIGKRILNNQDGKIYRDFSNPASWESLPNEPRVARGAFDYTSVHPHALTPDVKCEPKIK